MRSELAGVIRRFENRKITRRQFIAQAAALGLSMSAIASLLAACAPAATPVPPTATPVPAVSPEAAAGKYAGKTLTVQVWAGSYEEQYTKYVYDPFEKMTGATIRKATTIEYFTVAKMQQEVASGKPQLDASVMLPSDVVRAGELKIVEPLTEDKVPNMKKLRPLAKSLLPNGVGYLVYSYGYGYRLNIEEKKGFMPKCWKDLWDPRLKKSITLGKTTPTYSIQSFNLMVTGKLSPVVEDTWKKLYELSPNVHSLQDAPAGMEDLLVREEVYIAILFDGRIWTMADAGVPVDYRIPCEGLYGNLDFFSILKGTPNLDLAYEFVNFALSAQPQKDIGLHLHYGPTNTEVVYSAEEGKRVIDGDEEWKGLQMEDAQYVAEQTDAWTEKWTEWAASLG